MKFSSLVAVLLCAASLAAQAAMQEALRLHAAGRHGDAAAALRVLAEAEPESAEVHYNLALVCWRAGDLAGAETAIEKYAALSRQPRRDLHAGMLGNVRFDESRRHEAAADAAAAGGDPAADPLPHLEQALATCKQALGHFVRGAAATDSAELRRNAERALRRAAALQEKIDALREQRQQQDDQGEPKGDDEPGEKGESKDEPKGEEKGEPKSDQKGEQKQPPGEPEPPAPKDPASPESKPGEPQHRPPTQEPNPGEAQPPEPRPEQGQPEQVQPPEPKPALSEQPEPGAEAASEPQPEAGKAEAQREPTARAARGDAPGEQREGRELSPEQTRRLFDLLKKLDEQVEALRARAHSKRPPVERDW